MEEDWKRLLHENGITGVEYDDDRSDYSSDDDTTASPSSSGDVPQNQIKSLSKFYQGRSQSYRSLSDITSINELAKKVLNLVFWKGNKPNAPFAEELDAAETQKPCHKPIQSNKSLKTGSRPPIPTHKNM